MLKRKFVRFRGVGQREFAAYLDPGFQLAGIQNALVLRFWHTSLGYVNGIHAAGFIQRVHPGVIILIIITQC